MYCRPRPPRHSSLKRLLAIPRCWWCEDRRKIPPLPLDFTGSLVNTSRNTLLFTNIGTFSINLIMPRGPDTSKLMWPDYKGGLPVSCPIMGHSEVSLSPEPSVRQESEYPRGNSITYNEPTLSKFGHGACRFHSLCIWATAQEVIEQAVCGCGSRGHSRFYAAVGQPLPTRWRRDALTLCIQIL